MWFKWLLIGLLVLSALMSVADAGPHDRKPFTQTMAMWHVVLTSLLIWGILANF